MAEPKRYVLAGTGGRGVSMFARPLLTDHLETAELVGVFDHNPLRLNGAETVLEASLPKYTDFGQMLDQLDPDCVLVATVDRTHAEYVQAALQATKNRRLLSGTAGSR